jgi:hypothetical protein
MRNLLTDYHLGLLKCKVESLKEHAVIQLTRSYKRMEMMPSFDSLTFVKLRVLENLVFSSNQNDDIMFLLSSLKVQKEQMKYRPKENDKYGLKLAQMYFLKGRYNKAITLLEKEEKLIKAQIVEEGERLNLMDSLTIIQNTLIWSYYFDKQYVTAMQLLLAVFDTSKDIQKFCFMLVIDYR